MYNEHEPYVRIATEKFGNTQMRLLAREITKIFNNIPYYRSLSS